MSESSEGRHLRFAVIGAGMAGILSAIKLQEAGYDDFTIYEKADRMGGTWRENTYPGIACDVPSHLYSYSFALNPSWSYKFSPGAEILAYFERVAREHDVERRVRFNAQVEQCEWVDGKWRIELADGTTDDVDVVIAATGVFDHPRMPDIPGLEDFEGPMFHTAKWDHSVSLEDARVGVIGTGSSGIQVTGALAGKVPHFTLFQRTAQWIAPQDQIKFSSEEQAELAADPERLLAMHEQERAGFSLFANAVVNAASPEMTLIEQMCKEHLETAVRDPELREKLRPDYRAGCKRLVVSPDFYAAIQSENAELVTEPIERIEAGGVRTADGVLHELDVLVIATGFKTHDFMRPMEIIGRDGTTLTKAWADRAKAYLSISIPDMPNFFMLNGPNGPVGNFSLIGVAEQQLSYVLQLVDLLASGKHREISASHDALDRFEDERYEAAQNTIWASGCRSWYLDDRGIPAVWPFSFDRFRAEMKAPKLEDYDVR